MLVFFVSQALHHSNSFYISVSVDGNPVAMSEDHRVVSMTERARIAELGHLLKDGESRICGMSPLLVMRT
jgi:hypothetical protein